MSLPWPCSPWSLRSSPGGLGSTRTDEFADEAFDPARITDVPMVVAKQESGGFKLLGLDCHRAAAVGDLWPALRESCR